MVHIQQIKIFDHETEGGKDVLLLTTPNGMHWTAPVGIFSKETMQGLWAVWGQMTKYTKGLWSGNGSAAAMVMESAASEVMAFINWLDPLPEGDD